MRSASEIISEQMQRIALLGREGFDAAAKVFQQTEDRIQAYYGGRRKFKKLYTHSAMSTAKRKQFRKLSRRKNGRGPTFSGKKC